VDPTPYIRTYAKDVARLTGTRPVSPRPSPAKLSAELGVTLPEIDESQQQGSVGNLPSSRAFSEETLEVTASDTFSTAELHAPSGFSPSPVPTTHTPDIATRTGRRDEILSRLRAKVVESAPAPIPESVTLTPIPPKPSVQTPAPVDVFPTPVVREQPLISAPSFGAPVQAFPYHPQTAEPSPLPSTTSAANLHTFKSDFADHIDDQKATKFSVLAAQSDAKDRSNQPKTANIPRKKKYWPIVVAIVLIIVGVGGLGGAYWYVRNHNTVLKPFEVSSLIFADEKVELSGTGSALTSALAQLGQQTSINNHVIVTYVTTSANSKQGIIKTPQPGGLMIRDILHAAPDILLRNIDDSSTVGAIDAGNTSAPFFVLRVSSYERTFAGMLGWEPAIISDLNTLYPQTSGIQAATTTISSGHIIPAARFIDEVVSNHDARAFKDSSGTTQLIYGYGDKQTLIIARNESAFSLIIERLTAVAGSK
jgi:hypothetical protein